jgi:hypothetical protein
MCGAFGERPSERFGIVDKAVAWAFDVAAFGVLKINAPPDAGLMLKGVLDLWAGEGE